MKSPALVSSGCTEVRFAFWAAVTVVAARWAPVVAGLCSVRSCRCKIAKQSLYQVVLLKLVRLLVSC